MKKSYPVGRKVSEWARHLRKYNKRRANKSRRKLLKVRRSTEP